MSRARLESKLKVDPYGFQRGREGRSHVEFGWVVEYNRSWWPWSCDEPLTLSYNGGDSKILEILFIVNCNMRRTLRNLNKFQRVELALKIESILASNVAQSSTDIIEKKKIYVQVAGREKGIPTAYISDARQRQDLGKLVRVGNDTVRKVLCILEHTPEQVIQKVRSGQKNISEAYFEMLEAKVHELQLEREKINS
jgi:hypothetical protein